MLWTTDDTSSVIDYVLFLLLLILAKLYNLYYRRIINFLSTLQGFYFWFIEAQFNTIGLLWLLCQELNLSKPNNIQ